MTARSLTRGCGASLKSCKCPNPASTPTQNWINLVWGVWSRVRWSSGTASSCSINPKCRAYCPSNTSRAWSVVTSNSSRQSRSPPPLPPPVPLPDQSEHLFRFIAGTRPDDQLVRIRSGTEVIGRADPVGLAVAQPRLEAGNRHKLRRRWGRYNHGGALLDGG